MILRLSIFFALFLGCLSDENVFLRLASPVDGEVLPLPDASSTRPLALIVDVHNGMVPRDGFIEIHSGAGRVWLCPGLAEDAAECMRNHTEWKEGGQESDHLSFVVGAMGAGFHQWEAYLVTSASNRPSLSRTRFMEPHPSSSSMKLKDSVAVSAASSSFVLEVQRFAVSVDDLSRGGLVGQVGRFSFSALDNLAGDEAMNFTVRLSGPSIHVATVLRDPNDPDMYWAEYVIVDPGRYEVTISFDFFGCGGLQDPGSGCTSSYVGWYLPGGPYELTVVDGGGFVQPTLWCHPSFAGSQSGRWVTKERAIAQHWYDWQTLELLGGDMVFVPYNCLYRWFSTQSARQCVQERGHKITFVGSSSERTVWYDLLQLLDIPSSFHKSHGHDIVNHDGMLTSYSFFGCGWDYFEKTLHRSRSSGIEEGRIRYQKTLAVTEEAIRAQGNDSSSVLVIGTGTCDVGRAPLEDFRSNLLRLLPILRAYQGKVIWAAPSALHESLLTHFQQRLWTMTNPRIHEMHSYVWDTVAPLYPILDMYHLTRARIDSCVDGIHYYSVKSVVGEDPTELTGSSGFKALAQILLNMLC